MALLAKVRAFMEVSGFGVQVSAETEVSNMIIPAQRFLFSSLTPDTCILNRKGGKSMEVPSGGLPKTDPLGPVLYYESKTLQQKGSASSGNT
jgi:hypothetical protein